jgi:hypothetical protein
MSLLKKIGIYIYIFFIFFGPKVGQYVDTAIITSILMILYVAHKYGNTIKIDRFESKLIRLLFLIIFYSIIVSIYNRQVDVTFYGRMIRSMISIISISLFVRDNGSRDINDIIINVLLIHAVVVIISATVYVNLQYILKTFTGYNKSVRAYRSTGLMMGFDMAGLLCNLGIVLLICKPKLNIVKFLLFVIATVFTSRFSILFLAAIVVVYLAVNYRNSKTRKKKAFFLALGIPVLLFGIVLLAITTKGFGISESFIEKIPEPVRKFAERVNLAYSNTDVEKVLDSEHFLINPNPLLAVFGTGVYGGVDPGYTRFINCIGFFGLALTIIWHITAIRGVFNKHSIIPFNRHNRNYLVLSFVAVLVILNFKNCYFFTGTFFELMMIELFEMRYDSTDMFRTDLLLNPR